MNNGKNASRNSLFRIDVLKPKDTLHGLVRERAAADGSVFALFSEDGAHAASDILRLAEGVAARMAREGVIRGSRVIVLARTSPALIASLVAIWRLGAMVCPAETFLTVEGLDRVARQFRPDLALIEPAFEGSQHAALLERACRVLSLAGAQTWNPVALPPDEASPADAAACIFTSGSTGNPKGVVHSHSSLLQGAANIIVAKGIGPADRVLCVLPMSHLNGLVTTFVTPLTSGGSVVYLQGAFGPEKALALIDQHACTWFSAVPTQYAYLLKPPIPRDRWSLGTLRFCRSASAPLQVSVKEAFEKHYGIPIIETMGMTETAGQIFCNLMPPAVAPRGSVGCPIGFDVRIVDTEGNAGPEGMVGEIQVRGPAMMLNYLDAPEETAKAFSGEWLRSGDLGRRDARGFFFLSGRLKDIAIFSGVNISLRAAESAILEADIVDDIACVGDEDYFFGETIVAYIVANSTAPDLKSLAADVTRRLQVILPSRQALKAVRVVKTLPRAGVGKVLKGKLGQSEVLHTTEHLIPRDPKQLLIDVLNLSEDMIHEDLALGMVRNWDSLGHVALLLAVESLLNRQLVDREYVALTSFKGLQHLLEGTLDQIPGDSLAVAANHGSDEVDSAHREQRDLIAMMLYNRLLPGESPFVPSDQPKRARSPRPVRMSDVTSALRRAGLAAGDAVLVHSDVAAIGPTEAGGGRDAILQFYLMAFQEVLTDTGTLAVCTSFEDYGRYGTPFVREESPSRLGAFSEYIRTRRGAVRSVHPIVSIAALGNKAEEISGGNHFDGYGCDSPWSRLHRLNAKIITIGMRQYPNSGITFIHYIEHLYGVPYQYTKLFSAPVFSGGGRVEGPFTMSVRYLDFGITHRTKRFQDLLVDTGDATWDDLGSDAIFCCTADRMVARAIECLGKDRYYFLLNAPNFRSGEIPMDGGTGPMRDVYDHSAAHSSS